MLKFGISPCPNDIYIFYAMITKKVDLKGIEFEFVIEDVETLNNLCIETKLPISKISAHAYLYLEEIYEILNVGGAISEEGPIVVTRNIERMKNIEELKIALPGKLTTASALMWLYWKKNFSEKKFKVLYSRYNEIYEKLLKEEADLGVLIHEGRFVYSNLGIELVADLGDFWKQETGLPIPLGTIIIIKELSIKKILEEIIRESILYANSHIGEVLLFVKNYAQELDDETIISHIKTYVNKFSLNLGDIGFSAINLLKNKLSEEEIWGLKLSSKIPR